MSTVKANAYLDASGGNTATINGIPLRPGVLDPENRIINGAFDFWQRGTSFSGNGYTADRWTNFFSGGAVTLTRQSFPLGEKLGSNDPSFFLRYSVSGQTLETHVALIAQRIEGVRSYAGETITVLGWARRSAGVGNIAVYGYQFFGNGGSPSASVATPSTVVPLDSVWEPFAVTLSVPSVAGKTVGTNGDDGFDIGILISSGNYPALGLQTIGVDLWGIHIKVGTHTADATSLYRQPELGPELARCQRYFQTVGPQAWQANVYQSFQYTTTLRATPTLAVSTGTVTEVSAYGWYGIRATASSGFTWTADAEL